MNIFSQFFDACAAAVHSCFETCAFTLDFLRPCFPFLIILLSAYFFTGMARYIRDVQRKNSDDEKDSR